LNNGNELNPRGIAPQINKITAKSVQKKCSRKHVILWWWVEWMKSSSEKMDGV